MNSLLRAKFDIPKDPDWVWLRWFWGGSAILHDGVPLEFVAGREVGRIGCVATPYANYDGGPMLAADCASEWIMACGGVGLTAIAPAMIAGLSGWPDSNPAASVRVADYVIVPPSDAWATSRDVWTCATLALSAVKPVYILRGGV